jgi:signal transduction histidine kinase
VTDLPPLVRSPSSTARSCAFDISLTAVLLLGMLVVWAATYSPTATALSLVQILPLLLRRVSPTLSFTIVAAAMAVQVFLTDVPVWGQVAMPVAVYSIAAYGPRSHSIAAFAVALLGGLVGPVDWWLAFGGRSLSQLAGLLIATELLVVTPWALGMLARTRRAYVAELIDRGHRLELQAVQRAELAASDERARIAREMHDVIAHGLSVMVVQADGARYAVTKDPGSTTRALETISATGRDSLAEMRRMLGLLRSDEPGAGTRPQPGMADVGELLEESRAAGMDVTADIGPLPSLPAGLGLTVYRIVQEGLTNVRKHAGPHPVVAVGVTLDRGRLLVTVADDGRGPSGETAAGHGLLGMRERVAVHGGRLRTGPRPGGGFLLEAEIPLDQEAR